MPDQDWQSCRLKQFCPPGCGSLANARTHFEAPAVSICLGILAVGLHLTLGMLLNFEVKPLATLLPTTGVLFCCLPEVQRWGARDQSGSNGLG